MAPGSKVYLYAFSTDVEFGNAVDDYITDPAITGKKVASMSIGWVNAGPYDGTGSINTIVNNAQAAGIFWANSAGNSQKTHYSGTSAQYSNGDSVAFGAGNIEGYGSTPGLVYNICHRHQDHRFPGVERLERRPHRQPEPHRLRFGSLSLDTGLGHRVASVTGVVSTGSALLPPPPPSRLPTPFPPTAPITMGWSFSATKAVARARIVSATG